VKFGASPTKGGGSVRSTGIASGLAFKPHSALRPAGERGKGAGDIWCGSVAVPTGDGLLLIKTQDIIRCEADGNYVLIYQAGKEKMLITKTLGDIESMLNPKEFFRVHNSHIVNLSHIKKYVKGDGGYVIMSDNSTVDVSRRKKEEFLQMLNIR